MSSIELQVNPLVKCDVDKVAPSTTNEQEPLIKHCLRNKEVCRFLQITANYWPQSNSWFSIDKIWYTFVRLILAVSLAVYILLFAEQLSLSFYLGSFLYVTLITRVVSLLPAQHYNQRRLHMPASTNEILALSESVSAAVLFGSLATGTNFISSILCIANSQYIDAAIFLNDYVLTAYLAFNMFFLTLDINVCTRLLEQLLVMADKKDLTMKKFSEVRDEIHRRVREARFITDIIIVPCAVCVGAIALTVWVLMHRHQHTLGFTAFILLLVKEFLFLFTAFCYVAKLNGKADQLTAKLAESVWGVYDDAAQVVHSDVETPLILEAAQVPDIHRLSIYASSLSKPISYTLVFKRVTWWNVAVSAGGFVLAIVIGIIRSLILADV